MTTRPAGQPEASVEDVIVGLRAWAHHRGSHVSAAVELLIGDDWPSIPAFRELLRRPESEPGMYMIRWSEARTAFDRGTFAGIGGMHNEARLNFAIALGEDLYLLTSQGPCSANDMLTALDTALPPDRSVKLAPPR